MDTLLASPTLSLLIILPSALAIVVLSSLLRSYYQLRHIPGPLIPSLTDWWATLNIWTGRRYHVFIQDLHAKYGPVVRWGPNRVSFSQPAAVADIYGINHPFPKVCVSIFHKQVNENADNIRLRHMSPWLSSTTANLCPP